MKVALVHDYIKEYGGAERVLEALHEIYPDAPIYTSVFLPDYLGPHKDRFAKWHIKTSWAQYLPFKAKLISPLRLLAPLLFRHFDFSPYDVVIVSATGAYAPNSIHTTGKTVHICYCHTPPRYLYGYATAREWKKQRVFKIIGEAMNHILRIIDGVSAQNVMYFLANSEEVKARIAKFYRKEATVIYPPVAMPPYHNISTTEKTYYVTGGRLARPKHIDVLVKACTTLGVPLKVFGKAFAGYGDELQKIAGPTIEFVGEVSDKEKQHLMRYAKAYLFASEDEDFGITPVEAMALGTPVIAYKSGGVKETVKEGKTGIFFTELSVPALIQAISQFEKMKLSADTCRIHAERFGAERFQKEIKHFVATHLNKK